MLVLVLVLVLVLQLLLPHPIQAAILLLLAWTRHKPYGALTASLQPLLYPPPRR